MRHIFFAVTFLCLSPFQAQAKDVAGVWVTEKGTTGGWLHVEIASCGDAYCGTVVSAKGPGDKSSVGTTIIKDMKLGTSGKFSDGQIFAPDTKKWYASTMQLGGDKLSVSGCVLGGLICRSQTWTRLIEE